MTTPDPKTPSGGGLPSRHRPVLDNLAKDTLEEELWALDDDDMRLEEDGPVAAPISSVPVVGRSSFHVPPRRDAAGPKTPPATAGQEARDAGPSGAKPPGVIQMNIGKVGQVRKGESKPIEPSRLESAFDDLDEWEDVPAAAPEVEPLPETAEDLAPVPAFQDDIEPAPVPEAAAPVQSVPPQAATTDSGMDEFSPPVRPAAGPVQPRPRMQLSGIERAGLVVLAAVLISCGTIIYWFSINRLPTRSLYSQDVKFPVKGAIITVKDATSYWRAPVLDGPNPEIVRRGTIYIPVVEITTTGGSGAIRAVFRDQDRKSVGDMVTLPTGGGGVLRLAGTAGFEESGTHAAYRAGGQKPWSVEILEAPSIDSPSSSFKRLFLLNLSTETR